MLVINGLLAFVLIYCVTSTKALEKCGPKDMCACMEVPDASGRILMDCEARHGIGLEDICNSISLIYTNVTDLNAGRNNFGNLNSKLIDGCCNLTKLDLHFNQISHLNDNAFGSFTHLKILDLSDNVLPLYVSAQFNASDLPETLEELVLTGNPLPGGNATTPFCYPDLRALSNLKRLSIDGIQMDFGPQYSLMNISSLSLATRGLRGNCTLREIFNTTFDTLTSLKELNLSSCQLQNVHAHAFSKLTHLESLDLSYNRRLGFSSMKNVTHSLQYTNIKHLNYSSVYSTFGPGTILLKRDVCYLRNTTLKTISMNGNRLELLETNSILLFPEYVTEINFADNRFTFGLYLLQIGCANSVVYVDASNQNKMHLPYLFLSQPQIPSDMGRDSSSDCPFMSDEYLNKTAHTIKDCVFYSPNDTFPVLNFIIPKYVRTINFRDSNMHYDITFSVRANGGNELEYLDFSGNALHLLTGSIRPLPKLKHVYLSRCFCSLIGPDFLVPTIETLQLDHNYLGAMLATEQGLEAFDGLVNLKVLNLSTNGINKLLPDIFQYQESIEVLDLSLNNIEHLDIHVTQLKNLRKLMLQHNSIHSLSNDIMQVLEDNSQRSGVPFLIDLRNNSITYSCSNREFLQWIYKYRNNIYRFIELKFVNDNGDSVSVQTFLNEIKSFPKTCADYTVELVFGAVGVAVSCCVILGTLMYKRRWKIRYLLYLVKKRYFGYQRIEDEDDPINEHYKYDAFISYSDDDGLFIRNKVIPKLEANQLSLCVHQRDFLPGVPIADNVLAAIQTSRRTVVILSNSFLKKKWCIYEFNMARMESIFKRDENGCIALVLLEHVEPTSMPLELVDWLEQHSYIPYTEDADGQTLFWDNLVTAIQNS